MTFSAPRYLTVFTFLTLSVTVGCDGVEAPSTPLLETPSEELYLIFVEDDPALRVPTLTKSLLGAELQADEADVDTTTYDYYRTESGEIWYYTLSGYIRWESSAADGWKSCDEADAPKALEGDALDAALADAVDLLQSSGLISLWENEEAVYLDQSLRVMGSGPADGEGEFTTKVMSVELTVGRTYLGHGISGEGSMAGVSIGCGGEIVGAEVLWRPIAGADAVPLASEAAIQEKIDVELGWAEDYGIEAKKIHWDEAFVSWLTWGRHWRQLRALPYQIIPVEFDAPGYEEYGEPMMSFIMVCLADETLIDEGLTSLDDI